MQLGKVIGQATATLRHATMSGLKLLVVVPLASDGDRPDGDLLLVVDRLGAGIGDRVMMTSDGKFAGEQIGNPATPVRWSVIGVADALRCVERD